MTKSYYNYLLKKIEKEPDATYGVMISFQSNIYKFGLCSFLDGYRRWAMLESSREMTTTSPKKLKEFVQDSGKNQTFYLTDSATNKPYSIHRKDVRKFWLQKISDAEIVKEDTK